VKTTFKLVKFGRDKHKDKPVGFYDPIASPVPNERPQFRMPAVRNAPELRSQHNAEPQYPGERRAAAAMSLPESP